MTGAPLLLWFRRDLRLADHPMLAAALATGRPLVPVVILDPETEAWGAAPKWRWGLAVAAFAQGLERLGARLVLRRGPALAVLEGLLAETGAAGVFWTRAYDPESKDRDAGVKAALKARGGQAQSFPGFTLHEPWTVETSQGEGFKVFTPFWRAIRDRAVPAPLASPDRWPAPAAWPGGDRLEDWHLGAAMDRGAGVLRPWQTVGEAAARDRLDRFLAGPVADYASARDRLDRDGTSGLSENLAWGEIGVRTIWHAGLRARDQGAAGAEDFLRELAWRDFAWHLMHHFPPLATRNWRPDWDRFPWGGDGPEAEAWRRGRTGVDLVDAAMCEMWVTGRMHNRARMVVASYLTKNLLTHWRVGAEFFAQTLTDWDPASNAMGWQWVAGSGPDAAPFFRIFNPDSQAETHDPDGRYRRRWLARGPVASDTALAYFRAVPRSWALSPDLPPPRPALSLAEGRARALAAWQQRNT